MNKLRRQKRKRCSSDLHRKSKRISEEEEKRTKVNDKKEEQFRGGGVVEQELSDRFSAFLEFMI